MSLGLDELNMIKWSVSCRGKEYGYPHRFNVEKPWKISIYFKQFRWLSVSIPLLWNTYCYSIRQEEPRYSSQVWSSYYYYSYVFFHLNGCEISRDDSCSFDRRSLFQKYSLSKEILKTACLTLKVTSVCCWPSAFGVWPSASRVMVNFDLIQIYLIEKFLSKNPFLIGISLGSYRVSKLMTWMLNGGKSKHIFVFPEKKKTHF